MAQNIILIETSTALCSVALAENGKITAFDNHENLMKTSETYRDIYSSQMKGEDSNG